MNNQANSKWLNFGKPILTGLVIAFIIRTFFFSSYVVEGSSMTPTLQDGNLLVINKMGYEYGNLERFDVIVFHANKEEDYVKRIIGLPGDKISYQDGNLYVNDVQVDEPYLSTYKEAFVGEQFTEDFTLEEKTGEKVVPEGKLFVIGDNRLGSYDSRHFGFIEVEQVVGKVNLRYYPFQQLGIKF
ncbi:signal peptidase I [Bacillus suaedaesalsae]|uniref:Signal peptidase I n=1 Tax=Bacillus suaedaesalsae TaxID=2810349 RepID=A0ABS2DFC5_9BACI|nr:signal peptidase I [Bacillus suaedaesalsae]MBM6617157.1 signal peptidase I [Bacillus suaedaesalsae]